MNTDYKSRDEHIAELLITLHRLGVEIGDDNLQLIEVVKWKTEAEKQLAIDIARVQKKLKKEI